MCCILYLLPSVCWRSEIGLGLSQVYIQPLNHVPVVLISFPVQRICKYAQLNPHHLSSPSGPSLHAGQAVQGLRLGAAGSRGGRKDCKRRRRQTRSRPCCWQPGVCWEECGPTKRATAPQWEISPATETVPGGRIPGPGE